MNPGTQQGARFLEALIRTFGVSMEAQGVARKQKEKSG